MVDEKDPGSVEPDVATAISARTGPVDGRDLRPGGGAGLRLVSPGPEETAVGPAGPARSPADEERELARQARAGDLDAFGELVERRGPGLVGYLARMLGDVEDARDVAQLTFVRAWERIAKYDPAWAFSTWLYRIASNLAIDSLRARKTRERTAAETFRLVRDSGPTAEPEAHASLARGEVRRIFDACAPALSESQRLVFVLREFEERDSAEVAQILGCRESTVRNHLFQARRILREELSRRFPEYLPPVREGGA